MKNFQSILLAILGAMVGAAGGALPVSFQSGTPARSGDVNANFVYLDSALKAQAGLIASLSNTLKDLQAKAAADSLALARKMSTDSVARSAKSKADSAAIADLVLRALPVGSVLGSMVTPAADGSLPGSDGAWILAAGQDPVNAVKIPDLRGVFLRGIDYIVTGRKETGRDSSATRAPGAYQADALQDHIHLNGITDDLSAAFPRGASAYSGNTYNFQNENPPATSFEGKSSNVVSARTTAETRPKNVAVFWYIKVK